jgi:hypothetical protein
MKTFLTIFVAMLITSMLHADPLTCHMSQYRASAGLAATVEQDTLAVTWTGERETQLRLRLAIDAGTPVLRELAVRSKSGLWQTLSRDLTPEFHVTSGVRRVTEQQLQPLRELGVKITPEVIEREKWYAFWDAPLNVPGVEEGKSPRSPNLPRRPEEIRRAAATYHVTGCEVKTNGARIEITFPGLSMGIFSGQLQYTVYRGTNLVRLEAIAKTDEPSVAYKYRAGLKGFSTDDFERVIWRDTANNWQAYQFAGAKNDGPVPLKASNRLAVLEGKRGSLALFPPPHTFFFTREVETNLGYVWYRKDHEKMFSVGIRQGDREEIEKYRANFALYNAPPGTWQRMPVYFYLSPGSGRTAQEAVLAFTHGDRFKTLPGYKTMVNHFHISLTDRLRESGSLDTLVQELPAMKSVGINIVSLSDFHSDKLHPRDPGPLRLQDQKDYFEAARRHSDKDFLIIPGEEPNAYLGGHYNLLTPRPVYWTMVRRPGQPFVENDPLYGKVYHAGSATDVFEMVKRENGLVWQAHPRTKGSTGYPDAIRDKDYFRSDHYLGVAFKPGMGMDLSEKRLCEYRCLDLLDDMNNWTSNDGTQPKYLFADCDTYQKQPGDDLYANFPVNYVKLERVPRHDEDWSPILRAVRAGEFFVTTGEILFKHYAVEGSGTKRKLVAEIEWTFPLEFVEMVWGDGRKTDRQIVPAIDLPPFGSHRFSIPFDATGKKWVRFAAWDSAGNGALANPVRLNAQTTTAAR